MMQPIKTGSLTEGPMMASSMTLLIDEQVVLLLRSKILNFVSCACA